MGIGYAVGECLSSLSLQSERPDTITGVICGSLCIADEAIRKRFADYQAYLERCVCVSVTSLSVCVWVRTCIYVLSVCVM